MFNGRVYYTPSTTHLTTTIEFPRHPHDGACPINLSTHSMNHFMLGASV